MEVKKIISNRLKRILVLAGIVLFVVVIGYLVRQIQTKPIMLSVEVVGSSSEAPPNNPLGWVGSGPSISGTSRVPIMNMGTSDCDTIAPRAEIGIPGAIYTPYGGDWISLGSEAPQRVVVGAAIFGPFQDEDELSLCISINEHPAKLFINEIEFCEDYSNPNDYCVDFSREKMYDYGSGLLIGVAASKQENGDFYLAIKFYGSVVDNKGNAISVASSEEMLKNNKSAFSKIVERVQENFATFPVPSDAFVKITYGYE